MTGDDVAVVQRSFAAVLPCADAVSRRFYERLFEAEPAVRSLFKADLTEQRRSLMLTLATVVQNLHQLDAVLPSVRGLAVRHVGYGVADRHYTVVGQALLGALADTVDDFGSSERQAWASAYGALSRVMIDAAHSAAM